jgi:hypothetical protein
VTQAALALWDDLTVVARRQGCFVAAAPQILGAVQVGARRGLDHEKREICESHERDPVDFVSFAWLVGIVFQMLTPRNINSHRSSSVD